MKNRLFFTLFALLVLSSTSRVFGATPYAAYCGDDNSLHFVYVNSLKVDDKLGDQTVTKVTNLLAEDLFPGWEGTEEAPKITKAIIEESFKEFRPVKCQYWFCGLSNLTEIEGITNIRTSSVISMSKMFAGCSSLKTLDLSSFETDNVTNMSSMFSGCSSLTSLIFGYTFNTKKVNGMNDMFSGCSSLTSLNLGSFDTEEVTSMDGMFSNCSSLTSLDLSGFNISNEPDVSNMFKGCASLLSVDLRSFSFSTTDKLTDMFTGCNSLRMVNLSNLSKTSVFKNVLKQISGTPLFFVSANLWADLSGNEVNIVTGSSCNNLVIDGFEEGYHQLLLSVPYRFTADKVTIKRNFTANQPYTLYMPFAIDAAKYGTFYTDGQLNDARTAVSFSELEASTTQANKPYLFVPKENFAEGITLDGPVEISVTSDKTETDGLNGVYEKKVFTANDETQKVYYGWAGSAFCWAKEGATVDAGRAYFKLPSSEAANAPARLTVNLGDGISTGISDINRDETQSISPVYNLNGQRVTKDYKGIVIKNGTKTLSR